MKRGFTLIEMLIVVTILGILMSIVFRLSNVASDTSERASTISRLQRVENCLSGYYAAFGSYPPVAVHGTRNIEASVDSYGIQSLTQTSTLNWNNPNSAWTQVDAACRSQPVDCAYPFPANYSSIIDAVCKGLQENCDNEDVLKIWRERYKWDSATEASVISKLRTGFSDPSSNPGRFSNYTEETEWSELQLFKFGLMSYLLPRYVIMMNGGESSFYTSYAQWTSNNTRPSDPFSGESTTWDDLYRELKNYRESGSTQNASQGAPADITSIPSQAICSRWIVNLEGICTTISCSSVLGTNISGGSGGGFSSDNPYVQVYTPGPNSDDGGGGEPYVLDSISIADGWGNSFYYYSPAPYQSYVLWSAGPNYRTFPPWVPLDSDELQGNSTALEVITDWVADDIVNMSTN